MFFFAFELPFASSSSDFPYEKYENASCDAFQPLADSPEAPRRFSEGDLLDMNLDYYKSLSTEAWEYTENNAVNVPYLPTSNAKMARAYARAVIAYFADMCESGKVSVDEPVYLLELGAGHARLSYNLLIELKRRRFYLDNRCGKDFRYVVVLAEFSSENFEYYASSRELGEYIHRGELDYTVFAAGSDADSFHLERSDITLSRNSPSGNPIVIIANYILDSLPNDAFRYTAECGLEQVLEKVYTHSDTPQEKSAKLLDRLWMRWFFKTANPSSYYNAYGDDTDPELASNLNLVLQKLTKTFQDESMPLFPCKSNAWLPEHEHPNQCVVPSHPENTRPPYAEMEKGSCKGSFLVPIGAIKTFTNIKRLARGGNILLLAADKGYDEVESFKWACVPHIAFHGSISWMVNFPAISLWFQQNGGKSFLKGVDQTLGTFSTHAFVLAPDEKGDGGPVTPNFDLAWYEATESGDHPGDFTEVLNVFTRLSRELKSLPKDHETVLDADDRVDLSLQFLRASNFDPKVAKAVIGYLLDEVKIQKMSGVSKNAITNGLRRSAEHIFLMKREGDVMFEYGRYFYSIGKFKYAIEFYLKSIDDHGDSGITFYNIALSYYYLEEWQEAIVWFEKNLALRPKHRKSIHYLAKASKELVELSSSGKVMNKEEL